MRGGAHHRTLKEIARDLTRSSASLSSASSTSNVSLSGSAHSLAHANHNGVIEQDTELAEEARRARQEMVIALKARREALEEKLKEKKSLLKELCLKEGELTGELPPEIPLAPGEPLPVIRKRVGTEFQLSEKFFTKVNNNESESERLTQLELELEIQSKITSAALKLANDSKASKGVRRARKISYNQSQKKLKELEFKVASLKHSAAANKKKIIKQPRDGKMGGKEEMRRGISVPDLEAGLSDHVNLDTSLSNAAVGSPRSCPSSPRKQPLGLPHHAAAPGPSGQAAVKQLRMSSSGQNLAHAGHPAHNGGGYIPSSVYLRSSYRAKQYPTLSTGGRHTHRVSHYEPGQHPHGHHSSSTLPSPYRNKYELNAGCDSPVGLYNCPQQRTSQAFSSLDDLDGLAAMTGPPVRRDSGHSHYPSLERSARRKTRPGMSSTVPANALLSSLNQNSPVSRPPDQLEVLENAAARGANRLKAAAAAGAAIRGYTSDIAAREQALDDLVYRTQNTTLRNTEEYPRPAPRPSYDEVDGSYPALPLPARRTTLLPGQTYPDMSQVNHADILMSTPGHQEHQNMFSPHKHPNSSPNLRHGQTMTVHARKVETTFGLNDSIHTNTVSDALNSSPLIPPKKVDSNEPKPPLFPKQYYLNQRTPGHNSFSSDTNTESPAVPRKLKPSSGLPVSPPSSLPSNDPSVDSAPVSSDSGLGSGHGAGASGPYHPFRETSKPFEMSDFYKYSTKFRKTSASSLKSDSDCQLPTFVDSSDSPRSGSVSQRSSTSRESVPPELPAKPSPSSGGGTVTAVPAIARLKPINSTNNNGSKESLADSFSTEMLAWYEQKSTVKNPGSIQGNNQGNKPATLV